MLQVIKKSGQVEEFDIKKIQDAILASAKKILTNVDEYEMQMKAFEVASGVTRKIYSNKKLQKNLSTSTIHNIVLETLAEQWEIVGSSYGIYRNFRKEVAKTFLDSYNESETVLHEGDKENANKDSDLNSTKQALIANANMRGYMRTFELDKEWIEAHNNGWIHIHDLAERYLRQKNCCLFNMAGLLEGGFTLNGTVYAEPKHFDSAINVVGDTTLFASAQQLGGFTIPQIDSALAPYAEKSYLSHMKDIKENLPMLSEVEIKKEAERRTQRELIQGFQGFETKLNTISNSLG